MPCQAPDKHPSNSQTVLFCSGQPYIEAVEAVEEEKLGKHWGQCIERVYCFLSLCPCFGFDHSRTVAAVVVNLVVLAAYLTAHNPISCCFCYFFFRDDGCCWVFVFAFLFFLWYFYLVFLFWLFPFVSLIRFVLLLLLLLFVLLVIFVIHALFVLLFLLVVFICLVLFLNCISLSIIIIIVSILVLLAVAAAIPQTAIHPFHASSCCSA